MRKIVVVTALGAAVLLGAMNAPAQAQDYPNVAGQTAFTQPANYMSLPGLLRFRYLEATGRWITRDEAIAAARAQGADVGPAPTGVAAPAPAEEEEMAPAEDAAPAGDMAPAEDAAPAAEMAPAEEGG